jgi:hypothetical protein
MVSIDIASEGIVDEAVARRLIEFSGGAAGRSFGGKGKDNLLRRLPGFNSAAEFGPWFVVADLDRRPQSISVLIHKLLPEKSPLMCFKLAVLEIEAWLLADRERIADFLAIPIVRVPQDPETLDDPKQIVVDLARLSRRRDVREDMVPPTSFVGQTGPAYTSRLISFATDTISGWRPEVARKHSPSLSVSLAGLRRIIDRSTECAN